MSHRQGTVWWQTELVGHLNENEHTLMEFRYAEAWLTGKPFPISISLPIEARDTWQAAHSFFAGLLPEGAMRQRVSRQYRIAENDDMGLLLAIGGDCAGALSVLPIGVISSELPIEPQLIDETTFERLVAHRGILGGSSLSTSPPRFSLAGVQDKLPVISDQGRFFLPDAHNPSSHILKFETIKRVCFAEYIANQMACKLGLNVVPTQYQTKSLGKNGFAWLLIDRYDRMQSADGRLVRLHQEDILQALGMPTHAKYQSDGGVSLRGIGEMLRHYLALPAKALAQLRDWQIFNFLIGNWDGHGKNLALLYTPGSAAPTLAPFYDLVAIEFLNQLTPAQYAREMALYIGDEKIPERITKPQWQLMAKHLAMPPKPLLERVAHIAEQLPYIATQCRAEFAAQHGDTAMYEKLVNMVSKRCRWTLETLGKLK
ncbi:type II toxin-antitoxin system HipA family toxin [Chrysiogenes arsenatis]|uniref:type II toxin-antitoxin system HipA family toxin n=1 Tax=Chrysiogenes arsenatis TaxID=309797 RepID=UPI00041B1D7A|nr:type II toxin-antitoxin system HipA family toxin [Chrysiogenes arsenatis]